ncbi:phosphotransferase [Streptomyces sp. NPDC048383]|uniref:phosphotransferase n=1 Tax=Streptomyces sp. NPDC048383 TaxID=3155386 RepID=UPI003417D69D
MAMSAAVHVDLRRMPIDDVLDRVDQCLQLRLDRDTVVRKRRSLGAPTDRGTWVRIERRRFEPIGEQGWNGTEAAAVLRDVVMPEWYQGLAWRAPGEPVMWRADELELITAAPVGKGALMLEAPGLPGAWWAALNTSLDALAAQQTPRVATPDTELINQELVTAKLGAVFPELIDTTVERWVPAHADLTWANVMGAEFCIIDWEDWGMAPRGLDAATLWGNALVVPELADRVYRERRVDLESRDGKLMALFFLSKIIGPHAYEEDPLLVPAARKEAARLVAELQP